MIEVQGPSSFATLAEWLLYVEKLHRISIDLTLERVNVLSEALGVNKSAVPVVTVAGTNGKGTTVASIAALLSSLGCKVGAYFSPHLFTFNERIQINQQSVPDEKLLPIFLEVERVRRQLNIEVTYFEFTTLVALKFFQLQKLDVIVLEVGLGGRLDCVNVVPPDIAVITTIGEDHKEFLGETLDDIAREKAGIIREGIEVIVGSKALLPSVEKIIKDNKAILYHAGRDFGLEALSLRSLKFKSKDNLTIHVEGNEFTHTFRQLFKLALQTVCLLQPKLGFSIESLENVTCNLPKIKLIGRYEKINKNEIEYILDVAHNPPAVKWLKDQLEKEPKCVSHIVWCSFKDKDLHGIIKEFSKFSNEHQWYVAPLQHHRSPKMDELKQGMEECGIQSSFFDTIHKAIEACQKIAKGGERIIIFGSFQSVYEGFKALNS